MKQQDLMNALSHVSEHYIADADPAVRRVRTRSLKVTLVAACLALVLAVVPLALLAAKRASDDPRIPAADTLPLDTETQSHTQPLDTETQPRTPSQGSLPVKQLTAVDFSSDRTKGEVSDAFRAAYASLAMRLLNACRADAGDSTLISPLSVMTALAMTANGAGGETLAQMETLLGGTLSITELNQQLFNLYEGALASERATLRAANSLWVTNAPTFSVGADFLRDIENTYRADVLSLDFGDSVYAADVINAWCREKTREMIPEVVTERDMGEDTVMMLLNALCFEAKWEHPFLDIACHDGAFYGTAGAETVKMMNGEGAAYLSGEKEEGFVLYYEGGEYLFAALLPEKGLTMPEYLETLTGERLMTVFASANPYEQVNLQLPAFSLDYAIEMSTVLQDLGMTDAFSFEKADFKRMGTDERGNLAVGQVIHKTHIDVDNEGTRAAAVTAVMVYAESAGEPETVHIVRLDRPFVYAILDAQTRLPVFLGTCESIG